jgi:hypothetical protein
MTTGIRHGTVPETKKAGAANAFSSALDRILCWVGSVD